MTYSEKWSHTLIKYKSQVVCLDPPRLNPINLIKHCKRENKSAGKLINVFGGSPLMSCIIHRSGLLDGFIYQAFSMQIDPDNIIKYVINILIKDTYTRAVPVLLFICKLRVYFIIYH